MNKQNSFLPFALILALLLSACAAPTPTETAAPTGAPQPTSTPTTLPPPAAEEPALLTGQFEYSNDFVLETYYVEQAVALLDMTGFVLRDQEWELPVDSQVLGYMEVDSTNNRGSYRLQLPARPAGELNDVDQDGQKDTGVQIFASGYSPNLIGSPFSAGDDITRGWPTYLASIKVDTENQDEVTGGKLVVWSPDADQQFPTGFGADGLLFTSDDPVGPLPAGYSVIDLDQQPFAILRGPQQELTLYEPQDVALKDFSKLSYSQAFDQMFEVVRKEYAFNGIAGKQPDWDALYARLAPMVKEAGQNKDAMAYYQALRAFTNAFKDGHVGLDGGEQASQFFTRQTSYGYGFAIRELDDGSVIVIYVLLGGPAEKAGIKVGARVTRFNNQPIGEAIAAVEPLSGPFSTEFSRRYQQARYLLRATQGAAATVTFANPGQAEQTQTLTAVAERASFSVTSLFARYDPNALPVEFRILSSGIGYIRINSNYDDLNLIMRLFERALKTFQANQLGAVIIDLRLNSGGAPLGLAGFFTDSEIPLGQLEYYSEKTGRFEPQGPRERVYPFQEQYRFEKMALLVDQSCFSACEIEAYGFSRLPDILVVGQYPTGGVEAEVARGQFVLPENMSLQVPTGRFTLPDGSIFLEGVGVAPTLKVPINAENVLSNEDVVLKAAEKALQEALGVQQ